MGLDMYLTAKRYVRDYNGIDEEIVRELDSLNSVDTKGLRIKELSVEAMYWRKANAIHNWFVQNCQKGVDECQQTYVDKGKLEELLSYCRQALETKDGGIIAPVGGFFFGSTEINEYYWADIEDTVAGLERCMKLDDQWDFYYQSSW